MPVLSPRMSRVKMAASRHRRSTKDRKPTTPRKPDVRRSREHTIYVIELPDIDAKAPPLAVQIHKCPGTRCPLCFPNMGPFLQEGYRGSEPHAWTHQIGHARKWSDHSGALKHLKANPAIGELGQVAAIVLS